MRENGPNDLTGLLDELQRAADDNGAKLSVGEILEAIGKRSFGPLLLLRGLLGMTPVAAVPSAPTIIAVLTLLVSVQLLFGRETIWIPRVLEKLSVKADRVRTAVKISRKPTRVVDRLVRPRLLTLTRPITDRIVAGVCALIALCVPPLEFLPFVAFVPSLAIAAIGLGLLARDGLLVLIALAVSSGALGLLAWNLLL